MTRCLCFKGGQAASITRLVKGRIKCPCPRHQHVLVDKTEHLNVITMECKEEKHSGLSGGLLLHKTVLVKFS